MGLETGTYVSDLTETNPVSGDPRNQGDDHLRLLKSVLKTTFPNASKPFYIPGAAGKSSAYSVLAADDNKFFVVDSTGGDVILSLPTLTATQAGWTIRIFKKVSANYVYAAPSSGTINGAVAVGLTYQYGGFTVFWDGTGYWALPFGLETSSYAKLQAFQSIAWSADTAPYFSGLNTPAAYSISAYGRAWSNLTDQAAARVALGLADTAFIATGTSGLAVPLLNATNTWSATQRFDQPSKQGQVAGADTVSTSTTLIPITGLSYTLVTGRTYHFEIDLLMVETGAGRGAQIGLGGTVSLTSMRASVELYSESTSIVYGGQVTALNTSKASANVLGAINGRIRGSIIVSSGGTLYPVFAGANAAGSVTCAAHSSMRLWEAN